jgi:alkylhydroperoxidase family enzyme
VRRGLMMSEEDLMALFTRRKAIGLFPFVTLASPSSLFLFNPSSANAQAATKPSGVQLLSQDGRPPASLPMSIESPFLLQDADLKLPNKNWVRGNLARAAWTWAAQLFDNPEPANRNNLGRYLVQIPGVLEKQLDYSTSLIFDTPSFRNGVQISGFVDRVTKELVINAIAQRRRAWYTMTHHAFLGMRSAIVYRTGPEKMAQKMLHLDAPSTAGVFDRHERAALILANKFAEDPKSYSDQDFAEFRAAFGEYDQNVYASIERPFLQLRAAREARAQALVDDKSGNEADTLARKAADGVPTTMPKGLLARKIDSQFVELCFLSMQFVALTGMFSALNIPDEDPMDDVLQPYPAEFIQKLNGLLEAGSNGIGEIVPPAVTPPTDAIVAGRVKVGPAPLKGARIPLTSYEVDNDRDFGITQGGQSVASWGWGRGAHSPGSLVCALQYLPDAGREEALYSLALMFNEDQTRNGVLVAGFVDRILKELLILKVYRLNRSRYGLEHHTVFAYNEFLRRYGGGGFRRPEMTDADAQRATERALTECTEKLLYLHEANKHPEKYSPVELAAFAWTDAVILRPHEAYRLEPALREALKDQNEAEIIAGTRLLDVSGGVTRDEAMKRLIDHQIAELGMFVPHMDGIGRAMTMMRLEAEDPVQIVQGRDGPSGGIVPDLDQDGQVLPTGYFNNRPGFHALMRRMGVDERIMTLNELFANPKLNLEITQQLQAGQKSISISGKDAAKTGEF